MLDRTKQALELLESGDFTCAAVLSDETTLTSSRRGVAPLLGWIDEGVDLAGACAADKVVGKGAALLYVILEAREVYAHVISEQALAALEKHGVSAVCGQIVPYIVNRTGDGRCPIESAVWNIDDPDEALVSIRKKIRDLTNNA